jgi:outer membrane protein assembly factor BamB
MKVSLAVRASLALAVPVLASALAVDVLTNRYDIARTGANLRETALCVKNISSAQFGKLFEREVDGDVYAQPLIKTAVRIPNVGLRDVVYVATTNNSLYAFDADTPSAAQPFWHVTRSALGDPVPRAKVTDLPPDQEYLNFDSQIGIVATPVIDDQTGTIYVVAQSTSGGDYRFRLHAFDLATGREKTELHSPVEIQAAYLGNGIGSEDGRIRFRPRKMLNRPGLLLVDGVLYLAFTAHLDGETVLRRPRMGPGLRCQIAEADLRALYDARRHPGWYLAKRRGPFGRAS